MSLSRITRRAATLAVLAPLAAAGLVLTSGPAGAIPLEGDPDPTTQCLRVVRWSVDGEVGIPLFRYVAILVPLSDC
jgi:hypothetical protein